MIITNTIDYLKLTNEQKQEGFYIQYNGYQEYRQYHSNGQLNYKGNYIKGNREDIWEYYHDNGQLMNRGNYINGEFISRISV